MTFEIPENQGGATITSYLVEWYTQEGTKSTWNLDLSGATGGSFDLVVNGVGLSHSVGLITVTGSNSVRIRIIKLRVSVLIV